MKKSYMLIVAAIALGVGFAAAWRLETQQPPKLESGLWFGDKSIELPGFQLRDQDNRLFANTQLVGKWSLVFFGFTHCPDICPTTLQVLSEARKSIADKKSRDLVQIVFISVDPTRDSPELLKRYVQHFDPTMIAATASPERLNALTSKIGIAYALGEKSADGKQYDVSHSAAVALINPGGAYAGIFSAPHNSAVIAADLKKIMQSY